jgi:hypothetical protein
MEEFKAFVTNDTYPPVPQYPPFVKSMAVQGEE